MGQYRPSSLVPSTLTSDYTIDATVANDFRCRINGTSPTIKYQLKIMKNDAASTSVYDSGVRYLSNPLYPVNYDGSANELVVTVPSDSGMKNGNEYKWTIASYWNTDDYYESYENVFKAYAKASVSITNFVSEITTRSYTFIAAVNQTQDVGIERFGWIIRNKSTGEEIINTIDENNIYSSDVRVTYDGFLSGTEEEIKVKCWLNDGTSVETNFQTFGVKYDFIEFENSVSATVVDDSGVFVKWDRLSYINGVFQNEDNAEYLYNYRGNYPYPYLKMVPSNYVQFDTVNGNRFDFPGTSSHVFSFYHSEGDAINPIVYGANGRIPDAVGSGAAKTLLFSCGATEYAITYDGNRWTLPKVDGSLWTTVVITPFKAQIVDYTEKNSIYPTDNRYPGTTLYPIQEYEVVTSSVEISIDTNIRWNRIRMNAPSTGYIGIRYAWIVDRLIDDDEPVVQNPADFVPSWDSDTYFLALFRNNLVAGNINTEEPLVGWTVYRNTVGSSFLQKIATLPVASDYFTDYSVRNQSGVVYYVSPIFVETIGAVAMSNVASPHWWDWSLIVCENVEGNTYRYIKTYSFDLDVSSGTLGNNTAFNELANFTKYAKIQNSESNYWSGTISAFIGNCTDTAYSDSVELMDELKALTTDGTDKFLKDRKGNMWKVRLNSPVSEKIADEYVEQAVVVTLGWAEIGDASQSAIIDNI